MRINEALIDLVVFGNNLVITDEMVKDKSKTEEIDKIKFFQYCELCKFLNDKGHNYRFFERMEPLQDLPFLYTDEGKEYLEERKKTLELELEHILDDGEKVKEYFQQYTIWKLLDNNYYDVEDLISETQGLFYTILKDLSQNEKVDLWNRVFEKYISQRILKYSVEKRLKSEITKFNKDAKKKINKSA